MKSLTTTGLALGGIAAVFGPELLNKMTGREVFWLLIAALFAAALGDGLLPKFSKKPKPEEPPANE